MSDNVKVDLPRAEYDAVLAAVRDVAVVPYAARSGPPLALQDLRAALRKLERASCGLAVVR